MSLLSVAGRARSRVDLVVSGGHRTAVLDVRGDTSNQRRRRVALKSSLFRAIKFTMWEAWLGTSERLKVVLRRVLENGDVSPLG